MGNVWSCTTRSEAADLYSEIIDIPTEIPCNMEMSRYQKHETRGNAWEELGAEQDSVKDDRGGDDLIIGNADPARLPSRVYLDIPRCLAAIISEMNGVMSEDAHGIPSLVAIRIGDPKYKHLPLAHSIQLVKKKNPLLFKARLCIRGGEIKNSTPFDTSSPRCRKTVVEDTIVGFARVLMGSIHD